MKRISIMITVIIITGLGLVWLLDSHGARAQDGEPVQPTTNRVEVSNLVDLGAGFTYQGKLEQNGLPVNGICDFEFRLFAAATSGTQIGSEDAQTNVAVIDGVFTVTLNAANEFGADAFNSAARWLEIRVKCPAGGAGFTVLEPRQLLTAAPYALGLVPGVQINNPTGSGLVIGSVGDDGIKINFAENEGVEIQDAETGLYIVSTNQDGIHIDAAGYEGVDIGNAARDGFEVDLAGEDGLHVGAAGGDGVHVEHAAGDGLFICATGLLTDCTPSALNNGIEIGNAEGYGVRVDLAQWDGLHVGYAYDDGVDVAGFDLGGYFIGGIQVSGGSCSGCLVATFGVNLGKQTLQPGDVVSILGSQLSRVDSVPMLMEVEAAASGQPVVGVVQGWAELVTVDEPRPVEMGRRLIPREGTAAPGDYVTIITHGPMQVRASALERAIQTGDKLAVNQAGAARTLQTTEVNGVRLAEYAPTIGIALEELEFGKEDLLWVLINPQ